MFETEERKKYELIWGRYPRYRDQCDGEPNVVTAFNLMRCKRGESLIDWGCGTGVAAFKFKQLGLNVTGFDIAHNCLAPELVKEIPLVVGTIWGDPNASFQADYAFSADVLEHIPPLHLDQSIMTIKLCMRKAAFLQVCTEPDIFGKRMNPPQTLHLSVMTVDQWHVLFEDHFDSVEEVPISGKGRTAFLCR